MARPSVWRWEFQQVENEYIGPNAAVTLGSTRPSWPLNPSQAAKGIFPGAVVNCLQLTTFCGLPFKKAQRFATAILSRRSRAARVAQARCGVMRQFFAFNNGLLAGGGSVARTSR